MKCKLHAIILLLGAIMSFQCQKLSTNEKADGNRKTQIISWLTKQKSPNQPDKAANIDLLSNNLHFSDLTTEQLAGGDKLLIIPIAGNYKQVKNINASTVATLLIKINAAGNIHNANIVLFKPARPGKTIIPAHTFSAISNAAPIAFDGEFTFLSITGRLLSRLTYENNSLLKESRVTAKGVEARQQCIDWYLVTTIYYSDGSTSTTAEYIGTTCSGCDCGNIECECPDDQPEGNSIGTCEVADPATGAEVTSETVSQTVEEITPLRKYKKPRWKVLQGFGWSLFSNESGIVKYSNDVWTWESLDHVNIDFVGMSPGGSVTPSQGVGTPSFVPGTPNVRYAGMSVNFNVTYQPIDCPGSSIIIPPKILNYTSSAIWAAQP